MTSDVLTALKSVITQFGKNGLAKINGQNVSVVTKPLTAVVKSLAGVNVLSDEAVLSVLKGLSIGSVPEFTAVFSLEHTKACSSQSTSTYTGRSTTALEIILGHLRLAMDLYNFMSMRCGGHVPGYRNIYQVNSCWTCGGNHVINKCTKPKGQNKIAAKKKKWEDNMRKQSDGNGGSGSGGSGRCDNNSGNGQYERRKFGNGVQKHNNMQHMLCNKGCGWNTTHTTGFHAAFIANPSACPDALPPTHPFHQKVTKELCHAHGSFGGIT